MCAGPTRRPSKPPSSKLAHRLWTVRRIRESAATPTSGSRYPPHEAGRRESVARLRAARPCPPEGNPVALRASPAGAVLPDVLEADPVLSMNRERSEIRVQDDSVRGHRLSSVAGLGGLAGRRRPRSELRGLRRIAR